MGEIVNKTKGRIKQAVGDLTGDRKLHREGKVDELEGKVEEVIDDVKEVAKGAKKTVKDAVK
jgi:uncharacterized protein YjbJ (UPF0337 family)